MNTNDSSEPVEEDGNDVLFSLGLIGPIPLAGLLSDLMYGHRGTFEPARPSPIGWLIILVAVLSIPSASIWAIRKGVSRRTRSESKGFEIFQFFWFLFIFAACGLLLLIQI
jgi:hypothetical protein